MVLDKAEIEKRILEILKNEKQGIFKTNIMKILENYKVYPSEVAEICNELVEKGIILIKSEVEGIPRYILLEYWQEDYFKLPIEQLQEEIKKAEEREDYAFANTLKKIVEDKKKIAEDKKSQEIPAPSSSSTTCAMGPEDLSILEAARLYASWGWVVHPLYGPQNKKAKMPGKQPILPEWQKRQLATPEELEKWFQGTDNNPGLVCGQKSGVTVIDFDKPDCQKLLFPSSIDTMKSAHTIGRGHVYLKYIPDIPNFKNHELGIEVLNDGANAVLPPAIHPSGEVYKWNRCDGQLAELDERGKQILKTIQRYPERKALLRYCFRAMLEDVNTNWHGADGRERALAVATEVRAKGGDEWDILVFACKMYGANFDPKKTMQEWRHVDPKKPWRCITIRTKFPEVAHMCDKCPLRSKKEKEGEKKPKPLYKCQHQEGEIWYEEIYKDGIEQFLAYNTTNGNHEIVEEIETEGNVIRPTKIDKKVREAIILPDGIEEYGTVKDLREEMLEFALQEFDPMQNQDLFALCVHLFLTTWFAPLWMKDLAERFIPIISTRGPSETGKKRFLTVARWLCYHSLYALKTVKVPSLFRAVDPWDATLILDEADLGESSEGEDFIQFINSRADGMPIPRYSTESRKPEWWYSFGMTVLATRKPYIDDGAESRTIVFPSEGTTNPEKYNLIPTKEWLEKAKSLQRKLLLFRLRHLKGEIPSNLIIPGISGFRVRESLLALQALSREDPEIIKNMAFIAKRLEERLIAERAASREGLVLNIVYGVLDDDDVDLRPWHDGYQVVTSKTKIDGVGKEYVEEYPLSLRWISESLAKAYASAEIARIWRGLGQEVLEQARYGKKRIRGVLILKSIPRLGREFKKYVPNANDVFKKYQISGLDGFQEKTASVTPVPLVSPTCVSVPVPLHVDVTNIDKMSKNSIDIDIHDHDRSVTHIERDTHVGGTSGTSETILEKPPLEMSGATSQTEKIEKSPQAEKIPTTREYLSNFINELWKSGCKEYLSKAIVKAIHVRSGMTEDSIHLELVKMKGEGKIVFIEKEEGIYVQPPAS